MKIYIEESCIIIEEYDFKDPRKNVDLMVIKRNIMEEIHKDSDIKKQVMVFVELIWYRINQPVVFIKTKSLLGIYTMGFFENIFGKNKTKEYREGEMIL